MGPTTVRDHFHHPVPSYALGIFISEHFWKLPVHKEANRRILVATWKNKETTKHGKQITVLQGGIKSYTVTHS